MDLGQWLIIAVSALLGVWFLGGFIYNRRRGESVYGWVLRGIRQMGDIDQAKWIGTSASGARFVISKAKSPWRWMEAIFLLETREILPLWLFNRLRGKRDELIVKADLRTPPKVEVDWSYPGELGRVEVYPGLSSFIERYSNAARRISINRKRPHLILRVNLAPLENIPPEKFFASLNNLVAVKSKEE